MLGDILDEKVNLMEYKIYLYKKCVSLFSLELINYSPSILGYLGFCAALMSNLFVYGLSVTEA